MTCQELRLYFEDPLLADTEFTAEAEHLAQCADCARFVEGRRVLGAGLLGIRESAPQTPAALDDAVLSAYRRHIAIPPSPALLSRGPRRLAAWCLSAAAMATLVATLLFLHQRRNATAIVESHAPESAEPSPAAIASKAVNSSLAMKPRRSHPVRRQPSAPWAGTLQNPLPAAFRSLMYCDELSCGGPMELIRVQLPAPDSTLATAAGSGSGTVFADVLVGPDGIARGIHIVE